jgi:hypothetical protein
MSVTLIPASNRKFESTPWGWIDTICNENNRCLRTIFVKGGQHTEMCRHAERDITLICDEGQIAVEYLMDTPASQLAYVTSARSHVLSCGMAVRIPPGAWYRIIGLEDAYLWSSSSYCDDADCEVFEGFASPQLPDVTSPDEV